MNSMFFVRVPPSRVLLLLHRRVVVAYPLAPRSPLTPHGRPSLAAL
jgi:surface protein